MVLKRGRKSEKKNAYSFANLKKMLTAFQFMRFQGRGSRKRRNGRKLTFHIIGYALSKRKFRISHPCWFPRWHKWLKNPPANAGDIRDLGSIPGSGRSPGEGNGNPFKYSCLENPMDRGAWGATVHRVIKSRTWLSVQVCILAVFIC